MSQGLSNDPTYCMYVETNDCCQVFSLTLSGRSLLLSFLATLNCVWQKISSWQPNNILIKYKWQYVASYCTCCTLFPFEGTCDCSLMFNGYNLIFVWELAIYNLETIVGRFNFCSYLNSSRQDWIARQSGASIGQGWDTHASIEEGAGAVLTCGFHIAQNGSCPIINASWK